MEEVKDNSYLNYMVMVYEMNMTKFKKNSYLDSLENLKYLNNITEFHCVVGQPIITLIDKVSSM